jgi:hypothetical protein
MNSSLPISSECEEKDGTCDVLAEMFNYGEHVSWDELMWHKFVLDV